jgi:hypothetical protein
MDSKIIQWNCRGLRANYNELSLLIAKFDPVAVCLQETNIPVNYTSSIRSYSFYQTPHIRSDGRPAGGVAVLVRNNIPHSLLSLNSCLQVVAVRITAPKPITVCSIYLPPHSNWDENEILSITLQLPQPILLLGDFNAHNTLWGCANTDIKGTHVENLILQNNLCILNNKSTTYVHPGTGSCSSIDLSLCDSSIYLDFVWSVHNDQCGSDHYPVVLTGTAPLPAAAPPRWKLHTADWQAYAAACSDQLTEVVDTVEAFANILVQIANDSIPKTKRTVHQKNKPWFNKDCKAAINERVAAVQTFKRNPSANNLDCYKMA